MFDKIEKKEMIQASTTRTVVMLSYPIQISSSGAIATTGVTCRMMAKG